MIINFNKFIRLTLLIIITALNFGELRAITIIIDPGHGGSDKGAKGHYYENKKIVSVHEKDVTLKLAEILHQKLSKKYNTYLTRSYDKLLTLDKRAEIAEKLKADLFISIHANADTHRNSSGFEVFYLDNHDDQAVKKVELVENNVLSGPKSVVDKILTDIVISKTAPMSKKLTKHIHKEFLNGPGKSFSIRDRGFKPGIFYVLALTKRPAVLIEVGFMTNPKELKKIMSKKFKSEFALSVSKAVDAYVSKNSKTGNYAFN